MQNLALSSYRHCYKQEARKVIGNDSYFIYTQGLKESGKENMVRVTIINKKFESSLATVIEHRIEAKYTFSYRCETRAFMNTLATKELFKPRLIREKRRVVDLLSDPYCELFRLLAFNYDLSKVNQGVCWSLKGRSFVKNAIQEDKLGKVSPRAYSAFDSTKEPDPKYFRQIFENSLRPEEQSNFREHFL